MVTIEEALTIISQQRVSPSIKTVALDQAIDHCLGGAIVAPFDLPSFDNSAMDGYAICGIADAYQLVGEVAAGNTSYFALESGKAMRIFTGSKVPANTTAVIMQEKTEVNNNVLTIHDDLVPGKNIRLKGGELALNQQVFAVGHHLNPASIGVIGSLGFDQVKVYTKPIIRMISTGNELIAPGADREEGQIYESNSHALIAALRQHGFECHEKQQIKDDYVHIKAGISDYLERSDVLILSGGISVGDYDYVRQALLENGVSELFYKIFQKPGKPLFFGKKGNKYVFALPGNPASSLTCLYVYLLPLLQQLSGATKATGLPRIQVPMAHDFQMKSDRPSFLKARVADRVVMILDGQSSSMIHTMAMGNALAFVKAGSHLRSGAMVECLLI